MSAVPSATVSSGSSPSPASFDDPIDVAFDRTGRMWVGNYAGSWVEWGNDPNTQIVTGP